MGDSAGVSPANVSTSRRREDPVDVSPSEGSDRDTTACGSRTVASQPGGTSFRERSVGLFKSDPEKKAQKQAAKDVLKQRTEMVTALCREQMGRLEARQHRHERRIDRADAS